MSTSSTFSSAYPRCPSATANADAMSWLSDMRRRREFRAAALCAPAVDGHSGSRGDAGGAGCGAGAMASAGAAAGEAGPRWVSARRTRRRWPGRRVSLGDSRGDPASDRRWPPVPLGVGGVVGGRGVRLGGGGGGGGSRGGSRGGSAEATAESQAR
jgi:hypothetical protein